MKNDKVPLPVLPDVVVFPLEGQAVSQKHLMESKAVAGTACVVR